MRVVICAIAKNEHLYINDWVTWHLKHGFDHIYIYDNDDKNARHIGCFINQKYANKVSIINVRGLQRRCLQHDIYTGFYWKYRNTFDYCLFCDIDEFFNGVDNVKDFLKDKKDKQIRIKWRLFGDDDLIERDMSKPVYEIFSHEITESLTNDLKRKNCLERQAKFILRGGMNNVYINSCHFASFGNVSEPIASVLPSGKPCNSKVAIDEDYSQETIFLNHYMTKSLSEFIKQRLNRNDAVFNQRLRMNYFWRINKKTPEKIAYLKNMGLE